MKSVLKKDLAGTELNVVPLLRVRDDNQRFPTFFSARVVKLWLRRRGSL